MRVALPFSLLIPILAAAAMAQERAFTFAVGIDKVDLPVVSLHGASGPAPGDLVVFGNRAWLRLDEPGAYVWADRWSKGTVERGGVPVVADAATLLQLDDAATRALRGVRLTTWNDRIAAAVQSLPADVPLTVTHGTAIDGRMPQLPSDTRYLWIDAGARPFDPMHGAALRELQALRIDGVKRRPLDITPFAETRDLLWLQLHDVTIRDGTTLLRLSRLRTFLGEQVDVDASWFAMAKDLRRFEVHDGDVLSLEALAALPNLEDLVIDRRGVTGTRAQNATAEFALPTSRFPKLRRLELRNVDVPIETARAFHAANPECQVVGVVLPELMNEVLAKADRVVVDGRIGMPRFEATDAASVHKVTALFASLLGYEPRPYPLPDAVFEFFTGARRIARIEVYGAFVAVTEGTWLGEFRLDSTAIQVLRGFLRSISPPAAK